MMVLRELINSIDILGFIGDIDHQIKGLSYDSRVVAPGDLFIAIRGFQTDGHLYLKEAVQRGAVALAVNDKGIWDDKEFRDFEVEGISLCLVPDSRLAMALFADKFYAHPSRHLNLIGVTGTNGKTTTCTLISRILEMAGKGVGSMTTIEYRIGQEVSKAQRTTPESLEIQQFLSKILHVGGRWAVIEVSSHSLALNRLSGCWFDSAILTNITQDHMDFHKSREYYQMAKSRLFEMLDNTGVGSGTNKLAVLNMDDPASMEIINKRRAMAHLDPLTITYGIENTADIIAKDIRGENGLKFTAVTPWGDLTIDSSLIGRPNIYNILAAISVTMGFGIDPGDIEAGISAVSGISGRFESINLGQPFRVLVDYAHTEDALSNLLLTLKQDLRGRLICVFGCGGDRDRQKRPLMGRVAAKWSDLSILTSDNPRGEDPLLICKEIEEGFLQEGSAAYYEICLDRADAIKKAIFTAGGDDVVVIAGKGHETTQIIGSRICSFDDREVARQMILEKLRGRL